MDANNARSIIESGLSYLPAKFDSVSARALLYAIGLQETNFSDRDQRESRDGRDLVDGPALGLFGFEKNGGVAGVLRHSSTGSYARMACMHLGVVPEPYTVWKALETNDDLAVVFARLLIYTDPESIPRAIASNKDRAWRYYQRNWRPGKPRPEHWPKHWAATCKLFGTK